MAEANQSPTYPPINAVFEMSAPDIRRAPGPSGVEIAFAGRSNAGKSTALNKICANKRLARTSRTPGRTQLINFFRVGDDGFLVDLPGYGYAKAPESMRAEWGRSIGDYLNQRENLVGLVLMMDIRHPLKPQDLQLLDWAQHRALPLLILLTKADKLSRSQQNHTRQQVLKSLGARQQQAHCLVFSGTTGLGQQAALAVLYDWLGQKKAPGVRGQTDS
jgi:GTP-binding protein